MARQSPSVIKSDFRLRRTHQRLIGETRADRTTLRQSRIRAGAARVWPLAPRRQSRAPFGCSAATRALTSIFLKLRSSIASLLRRAAIARPAGGRTMRLPGTRTQVCRMRVVSRIHRETKPVLRAPTGKAEQPKSPAFTAYLL